MEMLVHQPATYHVKDAVAVDTHNSSHELLIGDAVHGDKRISDLHAVMLLGSVVPTSGRSFCCHFQQLRSVQQGAEAQYVYLVAEFGFYFSELNLTCRGL